jgi:hypothetical protein
MFAWKGHSSNYTYFFQAKHIPVLDLSDFSNISYTEVSHLLPFQQVYSANIYNTNTQQPDVYTNWGAGRNECLYWNDKKKILDSSL